MKPKHGQIIALAKDGVRPTQISKQLSVHVNTVYEVLRSARKAGEDIPKFSTAKASANATAEPVAADLRPASLVVPMRLSSLLAKRAAERGLTSSELASQLLEKGLLGTVTRHD
tara:strand:- start:979 stop:1320 length:342 start_codon:yes stop_codon:yes gene_type:complete